MVNPAQSQYGAHTSGIGRVEHVSGGLRLTGLRSGVPEGQSMAEQCQEALDHGLAALRAQGLSLSDVTRVVYLIANAAEFHTCAPILRHMFSSIAPSVTLIWVKALPALHADIEFEFCIEANEQAD